VMQEFFSSSQVVASLFSAFFAMVSTYIAGLYFFLNRAPVALRLLAFFLLSIGIAFLGGAVAIQQRVQDGLFTAWAKVPSPMMSVELLLNPFPFTLPQGWSLYYIGATLGWVTGFCVYVALGYMTFVYRWRVTRSER